jgi:hypothetical protein
MEKKNNINRNNPIHLLQTDVMKSLTVEQMIEIEPSLLIAENYVKTKNKEAKHKDIYWFHVWMHCKRIQDCLVGYYARNTLLESSECWDTWHDHLKSLATNCR